LATTIRFRNGTGWRMNRPTGLSGAGGWKLSGGRTDSLVYTITQTEAGAMTADTVNAVITATETNTGRTLTASTPAAGGCIIRLQEPAKLKITSVSLKNNNNSPNLDVGQSAQIQAKYQNIGGDGANTIRLQLYVNTVRKGEKEIDSLDGGVSDSVFFDLSAPEAGDLNCKVVIEGQDDNTGLLQLQDADSTQVKVQQPASLVITNMTSSTDTLTANQSEPWSIRLAVKNRGGADFLLDPLPDDGDLTFHVTDYLQTRYKVVPPSAFKSGASHWLRGMKTA
jgi:hypothetical protein